MSQLPSIIYVFWSTPDWDPTIWFATRPGKVNLSLLIAWQIWLYSGMSEATGSVPQHFLNVISPTGFASLGSLAAEVDNPRKTLPKVTFTLVPCVIAVNVIPLLAALSQDPNFSDYE